MQYVVYPHQQDIDGQKVIHNRVRILVFPNRSTIVKAMKMAHPEMTDETIMAISEKNGYNKNAVDGSLKNEAGVDWFAFQEALGKLGYMGIIDIEGPSGGTKVDAADTMFLQNSESTREPLSIDYRTSRHSWSIRQVGITKHESCSMLITKPKKDLMQTLNPATFGSE